MLTHFTYQDGTFIPNDDKLINMVLSGCSPTFLIDVKGASLDYHNKDYKLSEVAEKLRLYINKKYNLEFNKFTPVNSIVTNQHKAEIISVTLVIRRD